MFKEDELGAYLLKDSISGILCTKLDAVFDDSETLTILGRDVRSPEILITGNANKRGKTANDEDEHDFLDSGGGSDRTLPLEDGSPLLGAVLCLGGTP